PSPATASASSDQTSARSRSRPTDGGDRPFWPRRPTGEWTHRLLTDIPFILSVGVPLHHGVDRHRHRRTSTIIARRFAMTVRVVSAEDDVLVRQGLEGVLASADDLTLVASAGDLDTALQA